MDALTTRPALPEDFAELTRRMEESGGEVIDLWTTPCWVAERDGRFVGLMAIRLMWQFEPLLIFPEVRCRATRRRACFQLYKAAEAWVRTPALNGTGIRRAFAITRMFKVRGWAKTMGWLHQYKRAPLWIKHF